MCCNDTTATAISSVNYIISALLSEVKQSIHPASAKSCLWSLRWNRNSVARPIRRTAPEQPGGAESKLCAYGSKCSNQRASSGTCGRTPSSVSIEHEYDVCKMCTTLERVTLMQICRCLSILCGRVIRRSIHILYARHRRREHTVVITARNSRVGFEFRVNV